MSVRVTEIRADDPMKVLGWTWVAEGGNGEVTSRGEKYDSESNAKRGAADNARVILKAVADGEIDLELKT